MKRLIAIVLLTVAGITFTGAVSAQADVTNVTSVSKTSATKTPAPSVTYSGKTQSIANATCADPGTDGICWYEGWQFAKKSICIESGITGFPGAEVGTRYRVSGLAIYVRFAYGQCAAAGFATSQTVRFSYFSAADKTGTMKGACAYTQAANYGTLTGVYVHVNVTGANTRMTACSQTAGDAEWADVFAHEFGHALGLSHDQPYVTSQMRDGHTTDASDKSELLSVYGNNPL